MVGAIRPDQPVCVDASLNSGELDQDAPERTRQVPRRKWYHHNHIHPRVRLLLTGHTFSLVLNYSETETGTANRSLSIPIG